MESHDEEILRLLLQDGRMSFTDLSKHTNLSTSAVHQRVRRLEQRGVVTGYSAIVDLPEVGLGLTAIVLARPLDPAAHDNTPELLQEIPYIEACYSVAGDYSYALLVRVRSTAQLEDVLSDMRTRANVFTNSTVVLTTYFERRPPAL